MMLQLVVSGGLIAITTFLHGLSIALAGVALRPYLGRMETNIRFFRDLVVLVAMALWLMTAHFLEIALWASTYQSLNIRPDFASAFFLSSLCYTTLGLDGIAIDPAWQWLPGANAANGFLLFGMSAAFMLEIFGRLRMNRH